MSGLEGRLGVLRLRKVFHRTSFLRRLALARSIKQQGIIARIQLHTSNVLIAFDTHEVWIVGSREGQRTEEPPMDR